MLVQFSGAGHLTRWLEVEQKRVIRLWSLSALRMTPLSLIQDR